MKNSLLIPNRYKFIGWVVFILSTGVYTVINYFDLPVPKITLVLIPRVFNWSDGNLWDEIILTLVIIGLLLISFSKEKKEDEYISLLRLRSWQWSVLISYGVLFMATWTIYGGMYLAFMIYNMLTVLLVFIIKFNFSLYRLRKEGVSDEK
ncbi:hypothetical protein [Pedobacter rhizosphaerae]|uniref:Uncharacterized protein n=1 Tax=Pedobacter rhizosphaerae TaxID=390241 RepID=A0A1H9ISA5_9SPHI|nr:hypothetical protein [Pedobacter rhizosphaerae]SEQ77399.1 hypothetical protein SAMN04488023_10166 [Pedobacter rhizosphaerae]